MGYEQNRSYLETRSAGLAVASLIMGIVGLVLSCCIYPAFVFGSLAMIFALLSKGGEMRTSGYGRVGLILGVIALICGALFLLYGIIWIYVQFGSLEGYMEYLNELMQGLGYPDHLAPSSDPYSTPYSDPYSFFEGF